MIRRPRAVDALFYLAAIVLAVHARPYEVLSCLAGPDVGLHSPESIAAGVASTPYQYRVLVPWLVRALVTANVLPAAAQQPAFSVISATCAVLLVVVLRAFVLVFVKERVVASVAALSVHAVLPMLSFSTPYTPDDLPAVLLFTAGLGFVYRRAWGPLLVLFAVATLNRETSLLLTVVTIATTAGRVPHRVAAAVATAQILIWTTIQLALWSRYAANPWLGYGVYEPPLLVNATAIALLSNKALIALSTWMGVSVLAFGWQRAIADPFLKRAVMTIPVFAIATCLTALVRELRVYGEVAPLLVTAGWVVLMARIERVALLRAGGQHA
jgi:hypothetical protein